MKPRAGQSLVKAGASYIASENQTGFLTESLEIHDLLTKMKISPVSYDDVNWFDGAASEPRKGVRSGHVPDSKCIPFGEMLDESQMLLPSSELVKRFEQEGISLDRPIVTSCGTGVTACIIALGLHRIGKTDVPVYDGSWTEWGAQSDTPVDAA